MTDEAKKKQTWKGRLLGEARGAFSGCTSSGVFTGKYNVLYKGEAPLVFITVFLSVSPGRDTKKGAGSHSCVVPYKCSLQMKLILLVEDDQQLARTLEKGLKKDGAYRIHHVSSAEEALVKTAAHRYDAMIVDWLLPEMNGPELIEDLRDEGYATPILMLTVRDSVEDRVKGLESGADDYLTKPFSLEEVQARVRALLRRPAEWASLDEINVGPLEVNSALQEAQISGEVLDLRKKEFDLLRLLADREPDVVSRTVIAERVWGSEFVSDNSIDVTVSGLRKKIQETEKGQQDDVRLETVRGVGYRLMVENGQE